MASEASNPPEPNVKEDSSKVSAQTAGGLAAVAPQLPAQNLELAANSDSATQDHPVFDKKAFPGAVMELKPDTKLEDAGQEQSDANTDGTKAIIDTCQTNTASALAMDQHSVANVSDDEIEKEAKGLLKEEGELQSKESEGDLTPQEENRLQQVQGRIQQLEEVLRKRNLPQTRAAIKCFTHDQLPKSFAPVNKTAKTKDSKKRKSEAAKNDNPVAKKPRIHTKPTKGQMKAFDFVTKSMFSQMSGEKEGNFDADAVKNLEPISKAPAAIRDHLKAIQAAGLRVPNANPEVVKAQTKALGGMSQAFRTIISPWVADGDGEKTVEDFKWQIAGMRHPLHHHQLVAAGNMSTIEKDDENDSTTKFGLQSGLLYDHMGYGKTPETLACIISNRPKGKRTMNGSFTTLVVVPKSAAKQWADEVANHCTNLKATLYNKTSEASRSSRQHALSADILIVTYDELRAAHKRVEQKKIPKSLLFESKFYRIVLDESHKIKSPTSEVFKVCLKLTGKHKWCLSGTPIQNGVFEIYAPLKFLGHPLVGDFSDFKEKYLGGRGGKNLPTEGPRYSELSQLLEPLMILRSPDHSFLGRPLVSLPETHATMIRLELSREEEVIHNYLDEYIGAYFEKNPEETQTKETQTEETQTEEPASGRKMKAKTANKPSEEFGIKSLKGILLRMRQAAVCPALLENLVKGGIWTLDQIRAMKQEAQDGGIADTPFIDLFETWIKEPKPSKLSNVSKKTAVEWAMKVAASCAQCNKPLSEEGEPQETDCGCHYHKACLESLIEFLQWKHKGKEPQCLGCPREIGEYRPYSLLPMGDTRPRKTKTSRARLRGDDFNCFQPQDASGSTLMRHVDASSAVPQSSKMKDVLKQILDWQQEAGDDKIIIFSNFIGVSRLLGRVLQDNGIEFLYFIGEMDADQRQRAISAFKTNNDIKVLLMSMKCGSESLNLTAGNRIIILDLWWNRSVEAQAIARVYRIGQTKVTHAVRFLANNTIDDKIYELQEKKLDQMKGSLQEFHAEKGLGARSLRSLLGGRWKVKEDDNYVSDDDTEFDTVVKDDDDPEDGDYQD